MSYRCNACNVVCNHAQIKVVTETRPRTRGGWEIAKESCFCEDCAVKNEINVPVRAVKATPNGEGHFHAEDDEQGSTLVGSY